MEGLNIYKQENNVLAKQSFSATISDDE